MPCGKHKKEIVDNLRGSGEKITEQRLKILDIFYHAKNPLLTEDIVFLLSKKGAIVDRSTCYRNIKTLQNANLIVRIGTSEHGHLYALKIKEHEHYIYCIKCRKREKLGICFFSASVVNSILKKIGFSKIVSHSLDILGVCERCAKSIKAE